MIDQGRIGFVGHCLVKVPILHKATGKQYAVGDRVEVQLVEHCGEIVFEFFDVENPEFIDPEKFDPANFDREYGIWCNMQIANDCSGIVEQDGQERAWFFDKCQYVLGRVCSHQGSVIFHADHIKFDGVHSDAVRLPLGLFRDDMDTIEYLDGIGYEIEEVPRFFNVLG